MCQNFEISKFWRETTSAISDIKIIRADKLKIQVTLSHVAGSVQLRMKTRFGRQTLSFTMSMHAIIRYAAGAWGLGLAYLGMRGHVHASENSRVCVLGASHGSVKVLGANVTNSMSCF